METAMSGLEALSEFLRASRRGPATITLRIEELKHLSDALLVTLRKDNEKETMQKFIERVGARLRGKCPKCSQALAGPGIVSGAFAMEAAQMIFGGGSSRAQ